MEVALLGGARCILTRPGAPTSAI